MIEGTWLPVEAELGGQKFPDELLKTMKLTMSDGRYTVNVGEQIDNGLIKLEPATKPKAIDITGTAVSAIGFGRAGDRVAKIPIWVGALRYGRSAMVISRNIGSSRR